QIVAKAMNKTGISAGDKATLEQLEREFASELNTLGVKVEGLQKQIDNQPKVSGDARLRYFDQENPNSTNNTDFRARVGIDGKINEDMRFSARVTSGDMNVDGSPIGTASNSSADAGIDTANVSYKALTVGRQDVKLADGYLFDNTMNAVAIGSNGLKLVAGNRFDDSANQSNRIYAAEYGTTAHGAKLAADYYKNDTTDQQIYGVNASIPMGNALSANAGYYKSNINDDTAVSYGVALPNTGLSATYRSVDQGAYTGFGALSNDGGNLGAGGFKGMEYAYDKGIAKNTELNVKYQDFDNKTTGLALGARTTAAVNIKF
ncbi:MAG: S-layer homology domain-containing protein, partial [Sporomusaceae bacterium]|nr:S-layer homology domain-containing protein [Sporomusaceae bacterium]